MAYALRLLLAALAVSAGLPVRDRPVPEAVLGGPETVFRHYV